MEHSALSNVMINISPNKMKCPCTCQLLRGLFCGGPLTTLGDYIKINPLLKRSTRGEWRVKISIIIIIIRDRQTMDTLIIPREIQGSTEHVTGQFPPSVRSDIEIQNKVKDTQIADLKKIIITTNIKTD